jgi:hypothetical protein
MKRLAMLLAIFTLATAAIVGTASTQSLPPHGHLLLIGMEFDAEGEPIGFRKCVELAAGKPVPLHAHHDRLHAPQKLLSTAGHMIVPTAELTPWTNCAEFIEFVFGE